jgi:hypothetical protein
MSRYSDTDTYSQAGDWLAGAARRNPEALLLLAAGCCLLMRSRGNSSSRTASRSRYREVEHGHQSGSGRISSSTARSASNVRDGLSRAADSATDYASEIKDRVSETAGAYADSISEFAQDARRNVSERSTRLGRQAQSTLQGGMERVLREQPLAVAVAGLAAGAAVAALFPSTEMEGRTLGGAREALTDAAGKAGEMVMDAAGKAKERLQAAAEERGFSSEGLQGLASEVAETFTGAVAGKSADRDSPPTAPKSPASGSAVGQSGSSAGAGFGAGQNKGSTNRSPDMARANNEPGRGNR